MLQDCHNLGCSQGPRPDPCRGICPSYRAYSVPHFRDTTPATPPPRKANYQPTGLKRLGSLFIDMLCASPPRPSDQALKSSHPPTSTYSVLCVAPSCGNAEVRVLIHDMSQQVCHTTFPDSSPSFHVAWHQALAVAVKGKQAFLKIICSSILSLATAGQVLNPESH